MDSGKRAAIGHFVSSGRVLFPSGIFQLCSNYYKVFRRLSKKITENLCSGWFLFYRQDSTVNLATFDGIFLNHSKSIVVLSSTLKRSPNFQVFALIRAVLFCLGFSAKIKPSQHNIPPPPPKIRLGARMLTWF